MRYAKRKCVLYNDQLCRKILVFLNIIVITSVFIMAQNHKTNSAQLARQPRKGKIACESFDDMTSYCHYTRSLCYKKGTGFTLLTEDDSLEGTVLTLDDSLPASPFHAPWEDRYFNTSGPKFWRKTNWPYRSFIREPIILLNEATFFQAAANATWLRNDSIVIAFDADNYNTYHWANSVYAAFLARLRLEGVGRNERHLDETITRLYKGQGFSNVIALRPRPTDWQQNYADIALGLKDLQTNYIYSSDLADGAHLCFEKCVIPGASLYLGNGIANAQLFREMTERLKSVHIKNGWSRKQFRVTWFVRNDKRRVLNVEEARDMIADELTKYNTRHGADVQLDMVHWDGDTSFYEQASQMGKTRIFISTHGSALNHCLFMDTGGVVVEINPYQFRYPLDDLLVLQQGHYYMRHEISLADSRHQGMAFGVDPYPLLGGAACSRLPDCFMARRDADVQLEMIKWRSTFLQALDAVT